MADNIIVASGPSGATYNMATDDGFGVSADAQVQIIKPVFGDTTTSTRVSNTNPMPVQLFSGYSGGSTASIIEDGELKVKGTFNIGNSMAVYGSTAAYLKVIVAGGVTGTSGGTGVIGSTGNPAVYSAVEVTGAVQGISGGQALAVSATDLDIRNLTGGTIGYSRERHTTFSHAAVKLGQAFGNDPAFTHAFIGSGFDETVFEFQRPECQWGKGFTVCHGEPQLWSNLILRS